MPLPPLRLTTHTPERTRVSSDVRVAVGLHVAVAYDKMPPAPAPPHVACARRPPAWSRTTCTMRSSVCTVPHAALVHGGGSGGNDLQALEACRTAPDSGNGVDVVPHERRLTGRPSPRRRAMHPKSTFVLAVAVQWSTRVSWSSFTQVCGSPHSPQKGHTHSFFG